MRLKKVIKRFEFTENNRSLMTIGTDVSLNPNTHKLQLKESEGGYSTSANLYAKTWVINPNSVKQWQGFDVYVTHGKDYLGDETTSLGFRLGDGTDEYYWNGASWEVNTSDWNTEEEVATNISSFIVTDRKLQIIINLVTTRSDHTPVIEEIRVLYDSDIEFQDDIIFDSLIPFMKDNIRPIGRYLIKMASTSDTIDLTNDYPLKTAYNITGIDSVYNHTDDPGHATDLYQSYNVNTKIITLSSSVAQDKKVWIRFYYEPEIAVSTDREYIENDVVPAIHMTNIEEINDKRIPGYTCVRDKAAGTAVKLKNPRQKDLEFFLAVVTASQLDQQRLVDEVRNFFENNITLKSKGLDEDYPMVLTRGYEARTGIVEQRTLSGNLRFVIKNILYSYRQDENVYIVTSFNVSGDLNVTIS